jgi:hypothetical protein
MFATKDLSCVLESKNRLIGACLKFKLKCFCYIAKRFTICMIFGGAAAWSSGFACVSFVLEDRGSNPSAGTREEQITFFKS